MMNTIGQINKNLNTRTDRSAWSKGVTSYALEIMGNVAERAAHEGHEPQSREEMIAFMLNGANDWNQYSWGGSSLIYDGEIAERLYTPSELKKTRGGERRPNSHEEWLDVQARALYQACNRILKAYYKVTH